MADKAWQEMTEKERIEHLLTVVTAQGQEIRELRASVEACVTEIGNLRGDAEKLKQKFTEAEALAKIVL
jgi:predicted RNase H-like nuclease (RuvC/YqgF family)